MFATMMAGMLAASPAVAAAAPARAPVACSTSDRSRERIRSLSRASLENVQACAKTNDSVAVLELADRYLLHRGLPHEPERALALFTQADGLGDPRAKGLIANYHYLRRQPAKAFEWAKAAAAANDGMGQRVLGELYKKGFDGVAPDGKLAEKWLTAAANQGEFGATYQLYQLYLEAKLVPRDPEKLALWEERDRFGQRYSTTWSPSAEASLKAGGRREIVRELSFAIPPGWGFRNVSGNANVALLEQDGILVSVLGQPNSPSTAGEDLDAYVKKSAASLLPNAAESAAVSTPIAFGDFKGHAVTLSAKPGGPGFTMLSQQQKWGCVSLTAVRGPTHVLVYYVGAKDCDGADYKRAKAMLPTVQLVN